MKNKENLTSGSEFITNQTNFSNIFTPEDFTEEHIMMRESVKNSTIVKLYHLDLDLKKRIIS